jgi:hypothetical protein
LHLQQLKVQKNKKIKTQSKRSGLIKNSHSEYFLISRRKKGGEAYGEGEGKKQTSPVDIGSIRDDTSRHWIISTNPNLTMMIVEEIKIELLPKPEKSMGDRRALTPIKIRMIVIQMKTPRGPSEFGAAIVRTVPTIASPSAAG